MAEPAKNIIAFRVAAPLMNAIAGVLNQLPASQSRALLNRLEAGEASPIFEGETSDLGGHKRATPPPSRPPRGKQARKRKVANKRGGQ